MCKKKNLQAKQDKTKLGILDNIGGKSAEHVSRLETKRTNTRNMPTSYIRLNEIEAKYTSYQTHDYCPMNFMLLLKSPDSLGIIDLSFVD